jgi:two-component system response regulator MprA
MNERILIIEDDQAILKLLQRGLAYEGYTVDTAIDGRMGLIAARDHTPDLVVLDWMLPGMDGLEVCHRLRTGGSIPILMLTAKDTVQDRIQGLDAGRMITWSSRSTWMNCWRACGHYFAVPSLSAFPS